MYSIADILKPQFGRTWQEAVAVVQELALVAGELRVLPLPDELSLTDEGAMVVGFASETGEPPVVALARLLHNLLDGTEAPEALRGLAAESASPTPAHATVQSFSRALAFFERPGRTNELIALASRLRATRFVDLDPEKELERLREKVSAGDSAKSQGGSEHVKLPFLVRHRTLMRAAAFAIVLGGLAMALVWGGPRLLDRLRPEPVVIDVAQLEVEPLPGPSQAPAAGASPSASRDKATVATSGGAPSRATPLAAESAVAVSAAMDRPSLALPVASSESLPAGPAAGGRGLAERIIDSNSDLEGRDVYSYADPRVQPPVLVRRQLPTGVNLDADTGYFDLVVDQFGLVEQVRLISPTNSFRERILVSAAKAWEFRPARLDGRPVRFRMQVPITIAGERQ